MSKINPGATNGRSTDVRAALVALKPSTPAKSRLASVGDALRRDLAWAMAVDTLAALCEVFDHVLVVGTVRAGELTRLGLRVEVVPEPEIPGLNSALAHGAALLRDRGAQTVLASVGDLPALKATTVREVLTAAEPFPRAFVADTAGIGTTMLIARGTPLLPIFEGNSAAAHAASGAYALSPHEVAAPDARTDVDTEADLEVALRLGVGRNTAEVLERAGRIRTN